MRWACVPNNPQPATQYCAIMGTCRPQLCRMCGMRSWNQAGPSPDNWWPALRLVPAWRYAVGCSRLNN